MKREERRRRLFEPQTSHFEYRHIQPGFWYRRGPSCPTCLDESSQGVVFDTVDPENPKLEACVHCHIFIDVSSYGPREEGKVRVLFPPDDDDLSSNPYLNPLRPSPTINDHQEGVVLAGLHDVGNGRRLEMHFGEQVRYTEGWGWLVYDGRRWSRDQLSTVERMAKATLEHSIALADEVRYGFWQGIEAEHGVNKKDYLKHLQGSFSRGKIEAMLAMARSEPQISALTEEFDHATWLLNCKNGVVDLMDGSLRPHDPELYLTQLIPHHLPTGGTQLDCPRWEAFLLEVCCGDLELVDFLHRSIGYTLTGETREQKLFFLYGDGANGKSTFLEILRHILGDYGTHLSFEALLRSRNTNPEQALAHLPGKRYATSSEAGEGRSWNEEVVKMLTGGDKLRAKYLYKDTFEFTPVAKIWVAANDRPRIDGVNEGIWRRFFLIPFQAEIPIERRDPNLLQALKEESPGILYWAVRGAMRWYREGLRQVPECVRLAMDDYRSDNDTLARWISERCILAPRESAPSSVLLKDYNEWAKENKERELTATALGTRLAKWKGGRLTKSRVPGKGNWRWEGITTKTHFDREDHPFGTDRPSSSESRSGDTPGTTSALF